jgi:hypothetical protein
MICKFSTGRFAKNSSVCIFRPKPRLYGFQKVIWCGGDLNKCCPIEELAEKQIRQGKFILEKLKNEKNKEV